MLSTKAKKNNKLTEETFELMLPDYLQKASRVFFTPFHVAITATQWLTEDGKVKILDIGAGVGKFCIVGATYSDSFFYGIEYRPSLVKIANNIIENFQIKNASIINNNLSEVEFNNYDAFYLYNPFYENLSFSKKLNNEVELIGSLYSYYCKSTEDKLSETKSGTRLVTFHGNNFEVPTNFKKIKESDDGKLKLWIKQ